MATTSTRVRLTSNAQVFHRVAVEDDMPTHDVGTSDSAVQSLGGSSDFEIEADAGVVYVSTSKVVTTTAAAIGSGAITKFVYIKHTGFTTSDKDTASATGAVIKIGLGGEMDATVTAADPVRTYAGFSLEEGESIVLHGLATQNNNLAEIFLDSSSGNIYAEVVHY
jgi:hypothetical protein